MTESDSVKGIGPLGFAEEVRKGLGDDLRLEERELAARRWEQVAKAASFAGRPTPILGKIVAASTALVIVDMQKAFLRPGAPLEVPEGLRLVSALNEMSCKVREAGGRVVYLRYSVADDVGLLRHFERRSYLGGNRVSPLEALRPGSPFFELDETLEVKDDDLVIDKCRYAAGLGSELVPHLRRQGVENILIGGVTTDICVANTMEDLMQRNFNTVLLWDGATAMSRLDHELASARLFALYGDVMTTTEVARRLSPSG